MRSHPAAALFFAFLIIGGATGTISTVANSSIAGVNQGLIAAVDEHELCKGVNKAPDRCAFVTEHCGDENVGYVDYLKLYYCGNSVFESTLVLVVMASWLLSLFMVIGIAAYDFLCPNLNTMADMLQLSESLIGVTILAFGNGSPDIFSTYAAMKTGSGSLAIGELIGAASFITAVVAGSMAIVRPFKVHKRSFVRDISLFTVAVSFSLYFISDGLLRVWECALMLVLYVSYVLYVCLSDWHHARQSRIVLRDREARSAYEPLTIDEAQEDLENDTPQSLSPESPLKRNFKFFGTIDEESEQEEAYNELTSRMMRLASSHEGSSESLTTSVNPENHLSHYTHPSRARPSRASLFSAIEFRDVYEQLSRSKSVVHPSSRDLFASAHPQNSNTRSSSQSNGRISRTTPDDDINNIYHLSLPHHNNAPNSSRGTLDIPTVLVTESQATSPPSPDSENNISPVVSFRSSISHRQIEEIDAIYRSNYAGNTSEVLMRLFPTLVGLQKKPIHGVLMSILAAPWTFLLTCTIPVVEQKTKKEVNSTGDCDEDHEDQAEGRNYPRWLLILQCCCIPYFLLFSAFGSSRIIICISGALSLVLLGPVLAFLKPENNGAKHLRYLSFIGFVMAVIWISNIANEVVGVLKALGIILHLSEAILGLTVFAIGNSLADLIGNVTIAKMGYPVMALSACFGGPMLNILVGVGVSGIAALSGSESAYKIEISPSIVISGGTLLFNLFVLLLGVPMNNWYMSRKIGILVISFWIVSTGFNVAVEIFGTSS